MTLFITKTQDGLQYSLVFLEMGGKQYHRPTLKELQDAVEFEEMRARAVRTLAPRPEREP